MTAAPSMAEVLAEHREDATYPDTCICETEVPDHLDGHYADHLAQALADAGFGHVASVERERDELARVVDQVRRRHPRGDEEGGILAPGSWCPGCGMARRDRGRGACPEREALDGEGGR